MPIQHDLAGIKIAQEEFFFSKHFHLLKNQGFELTSSGRLSASLPAARILLNHIITEILIYHKLEAL